MDKEQSTNQPFWHLAAALLALYILTFITVAVSQQKIGGHRIIVPIAIAAVKSSVVLFLFMHFKKEGKAVFISFISTIIILSVLIALMFFDLSFR